MASNTLKRVEPRLIKSRMWQGLSARTNMSTCSPAASPSPAAQQLERSQLITNQTRAFSSHGASNVPRRQRSIGEVPKLASSRFSTATPPTPKIHHLYETKTGSWQYVVADTSTSTAVIIDPVLDYDPTTQAVGTGQADELLAIVKNNGYKVSRILETHAHADHMTAASYLKRRLESEQGYSPSVCIGSRIGEVQKRFSARYGVPEEEYAAVFDELLQDDEEFSVGSLQVTAMHLPGHTPDHMGYKIGDNIFTGDLIFHADLGTARADFPGGSASQIFQSAQKVLTLPGSTRVWSGHDYPPESRDAIPSMTVHEHREQNKHLMDGMSEAEFVEMRNARDKVLAAPRLLHQSLQLNVRGGRLPEPNEHGLKMLHLPLKLGSLTW